MRRGGLGGRQGGKAYGREEGTERSPLVSKLLTENINSTKSIKRVLFSLRMKKKKIQLPSKMEGLNEHSSPTCHKPLAELLKEIP